MIRPLVCVIVSLLTLAGCATSSATGSSASAGLYDRVRSASVEILVEGRLAGSGWFADLQGLIVTAAHVVRGKGDKLEITTADGDRMVAILEAVDLGHDIALLRVAPLASGGRYPTLPIADRMPPPPSDVYLFGAPQFRHAVLVRGSVGRAEPEFEYYGNERFYVEVYHVSAPSPHGTSGGCWVDPAGRVVGNQSGLMLHNGAGNGLAFVAPPAAIRRLVTTRTSASTPSIDAAVEELWEQSVEHIARFGRGAHGVIIARAHEGGPAAKAGLGRDTLIVAIDGSPVRLRRDLLAAVLTRQPGQSVTLTVVDADRLTRRDVALALISLEDRVYTAPAPDEAKNAAHGN